MSPLNNYICHCMDCGGLIKLLPGETVLEQKNWYENTEDLKLCDFCNLLDEEQEDWRLEESEEEFEEESDLEEEELEEELYGNINT